MENEGEKVYLNGHKEMNIEGNNLNINEEEKREREREREPTIKSSS